MIFRARNRRKLKASVKLIRAIRRLAVMKNTRVMLLWRRFVFPTVSNHQARFVLHGFHLQCKVCRHDFCTILVLPIFFISSIIEFCIKTNNNQCTRSRHRHLFRRTILAMFLFVMRPRNKLIVSLAKDVLQDSTPNSRLFFFTFHKCTRFSPFSTARILIFYFLVCEIWLYFYFWIIWKI